MIDTNHIDATAPRPTVLVTGASGGLGIHIVNRLASSGYNIWAFDRRDPIAARRNSLLDEYQPGRVQWFLDVDADDDADFEELMSGADFVVHAAGVASFSADKEQLFAHNRDLSTRLFGLACDLGVDHFVHISCAALYRADIGVCTEDSPVEAHNDFEQSKLDAEQSIRSISAQRDDAPEWTILRPGLLYGPGCTTMGAGMITLPTILRGVSRYLPGLSGGPRTNWCHVADAASAVDVVLGRPEARQRIFNVADESALSIGEVLTAIIEGYDIDLGPSVRVPSAALWALVSPLIDRDWAFERAREVLRLLWRRVQHAHDLDSPLTPSLDRDALFYVDDDSIVVADALRSLGWAPNWRNFQEGIKDTIRWYQDQGWAPRFDLDAHVERRDEKYSPRFIYDERLHGMLRAQATRRPIDFDLEISWPSVPFPPGQHEGHLFGYISIPELADRSRIQGTIELHWFPSLRLRYEFGFEDLNGHACRFTGLRKFALSDPGQSLITVEGRFIDRHGKAIGDAILRCTSGPLPLLASETLSEPS